MYILQIPTKGAASTQLSNRVQRVPLTDDDENGASTSKIPAWKIEQGLRPGTVVVILATLHVFNIDNTAIVGFRRVHYQINAKQIKVLAKPIRSRFHPFVSTIF
jgi:hypothetical protein